MTTINCYRERVIDDIRAEIASNSKIMLLLSSLVPLWPGEEPVNIITAEDSKRGYDAFKKNKQLIDELQRAGAMAASSRKKNSL